MTWTGNSRGFGFVSYDSFEASDAAIDSMSSQLLYNRAINVLYAYKKIVCNKQALQGCEIGVGTWHGTREEVVGKEVGGEIGGGPVHGG